MKSFLKIVFTIIRENKGFSISLSFLFLFGATLLILTNVLPGTVQYSFDRYMQDYNMPQASIISEPTKYKDELASLNSVKTLEANFIIDTILDFNNKKRNTRIFTKENNSRQYNVEESIEINNEQRGVWLSIYFAKKNNIKVGDSIKLKVNEEYEDFVVEALASTPDGMRCCYDETTWSEIGDFSYIYMDRSVFDDVFSTRDIYNSWNIIFNDGVDTNLKYKTLDRACEIIGSEIIKHQLYEDSKAKIIIDSNLKSLNATCEAMPIIIFLIVICCSFLFIKQIIRNQRKKTALLLSLGWNYKNNFLMFVSFALFVMLFSIAIGIVCGAVVCYIVADIYKNNFCIPGIYYVVDWKTYVMFFILFLSGIASCVFSIEDILKIQPGNVEQSFSDDMTVSGNNIKIHMSVFIKIAISNIWSQKRRLFMSVFSIAACMVLTYISFACLQAKFVGDSAVAGKRMYYDYLIELNYPDNAVKNFNIEGVDKTEPFVMFTEPMSFEDQSMIVQVHAIDNSSELVKIFDTEDNVINVGDGIILEEYVAKQFGVKKGDKIKLCNEEITVDDISRQIVYPIQYISFDTAKKLGYDTINSLFLSVKNHETSEEFYTKLVNNSQFKYGKILKRQVETLKEDMVSINILFYILVVLSLIIGINIIYNMILIKINEKIREYSSLLSLGTKFRYFTLMAFVENIAQYILALLFSIIPSYFLAQFVLDSMSSSLEYFAFMNKGFLYVLVFVVSFVYVLFGILFTLITIYRINPVDYINEKE